jgi:hypothetical protein
VGSGPVEVHVDVHVRAVQALYGDLVGPVSWERTRYEQVGVLAERLAEGYAARRMGAFVELHNWHPAVGHLAEPEIWELRFGPADFRLAVARVHGYAAGEDVVPDDVRPAPSFEIAVDTMLAGDLEGFRAQLNADPGLARRESHWPHRATLLHYAAANGVETGRQVVPANLPELVAALVEHGADVNAPGEMYGGARPLGLLLTSGHPRQAGVAADAATILRGAGAL